MSQNLLRLLMDLIVFFDTNSSNSSFNSTRWRIIIGFYPFSTITVWQSVGEMQFHFKQIYVQQS